jgi:hypothetical protein
MNILQFERNNIWAVLNSLCREGPEMAGGGEGGGEAGGGYNTHFPVFTALQICHNKSHFDPLFPLLGLGWELFFRD